MAKRKTVMPQTRYNECQISKQTKKHTRKFAKYLGEKTSSPQPADPAPELWSSYIPFYKCRYKHLVAPAWNPQQDCWSEEINQTHTYTPPQTEERREEDIPMLSLVWVFFLVAWYKLEFLPPKTDFLPTQCRIHWINWIRWNGFNFCSTGLPWQRKVTEAL